MNYRNCKINKGLIFKLKTEKKKEKKKEKEKKNNLDKELKVLAIINPL